MNTTDFISATEFSSIHEVEISFINSLSEMGLIEIAVIEQTTYIPVHSLTTLEKYIRLHHDLNINAEGIEAVTLLLNRIQTMQDELNILRNRLEIYEE